MLVGRVEEEGHWGLRSSPLPSNCSAERLPQTLCLLSRAKAYPEQNPPSWPDTPHFLSVPRGVGLTQPRQLVDVSLCTASPRGLMETCTVPGTWPGLRKGAVFLWFHPIPLSVSRDLTCKDLDSVHY